MSKHAAGLVFDNDTFVLSCDSKDDARKSTLAAGSLVGPLILDGESKSNGSLIDKLDSRKLASADSRCQRGAQDGLGKELPISDTNANITNMVGSNVPTYAHPPCVVHVAGPLGGSPSLGFTDEMVSNGNTTILVGSKVPTQAQNPCLAQAVGPFCGSPNRVISLIDLKPTANLLQIAPKAQGRGHEHKVTKQPTLAYQPALIASNVAASCGLDNKKIFVDLFKPQVAPSASLAVDLNHTTSNQGLTPSEAKDPREEFKLHHVPHGPRNNEKKLHIPKELATKGGKILESSLVGHFIGRKLPFSLVSNATSRLWGASMVGKPLRVDKMTASRRRITYARICIEVDAKDDWLSCFELEAEGSLGSCDPITIHLEYQWTPTRCSLCKCFGHDCNKKAPVHHVYPKLKNATQWKPINVNPKPLNEQSRPLEAPHEGGEWTEVVGKGKEKDKAKLVKGGNASSSRLRDPPTVNVQQIKTSKSFSGLIPPLYDSEDLIVTSLVQSHSLPGPLFGPMSKIDTVKLFS